MKKKVFIPVGILVAVLIAAAIYLIPHWVERPLQNVLHADFSKVDEVVIGAGWNGKSCTLTDPKEVKAFVSLFKDVKLRKNFDQRQRSGFSYGVTFYENGKETAGFTTAGTNFIISDHSVRYYSSKNFDEPLLDTISDKYDWTE